MSSGFDAFSLTESCCLLRLSTNGKPPPAFVGKVTFAESAADGQNKENDRSMIIKVNIT